MGDTSGAHTFTTMGGTPSGPGGLEMIRQENLADHFGRYSRKESRTGNVRRRQRSRTDRESRV